MLFNPGPDELGTFIVPAWLPGNKEKEVRNNFRINPILKIIGKENRHGNESRSNP
jgi:hypothetical protein